MTGAGRVFNVGFCESIVISLTTWIVWKHITTVKKTLEYYKREYENEISIKSKRDGLIKMSKRFCELSSALLLISNNI